MPINMPTQQASPIERIAGALNLVRTVYGIQSDSAAIDKFKQDMEVGKKEQAKKDSGIMSPEEFLKLSDKVESAKEGEPGAMSVLVQSKDGPIQQYVKPRKSLGLDDAVKRMQLEKLQGDIGQGKRLPSDKVLSVNEGNAIPKVLEDVKSTIEQNKEVFGPIGGRLAGLNPYDERAQTMDSQLRSASQMFGRYMEGGVLRKEDEEKYRKMFPQLRDTAKVAENKLAIVDRLLKSKQKSDLEALQASGFNIGGLDKGMPVPGLPGVLSQKPAGKQQSINSAVAADIGPQGMSVNQGGHTYNWNPKTKRYE